jgi:hypothetical protein
MPDRRNATSEAAVAYVAGAFWELLRWWFEQRNAPPATEVAATFKRLTTPVLQEIARSRRKGGR